MIIMMMMMIICEVLWDITIQHDIVIEARRPDVVVVEKESNKATINYGGYCFTVGSHSV